MKQELEALERIRKKLAKHYDIENIYEWSLIEDDLDIIESALTKLPDSIRKDDDYKARFER